MSMALRADIKVDFRSLDSEMLVMVEVRIRTSSSFDFLSAEVEGLG